MFRKRIVISTEREGDIIDITPDVREAVQASGVKEGLGHLFVLHSTAALTTLEYEEGVVSDLKWALAAIAPDSARFAHDTKWGDGNGRSHVKAALVGPSLTVPVGDGTPILGRWQQVVLLELDVNAGRERTIVCTVVGE
jgi:secondary thiamine-phosphate synthase enzyme